MDIGEVISTRVSIRKWQDKKVEREKIINVLEAARRAPSWANVQPWLFIVVEDRDSIKKLAKASGDQLVVETAPVVIICAGDFESFSIANMKRSIKELIAAGVIEIELKEEELEMMLKASPAPVIGEEAMKFRTREQIVISMAYMTLAAVGQGLGSCWIGGVDAGVVQKEFGLPAKIIAHGLLAMGYPAEFPPPRPRKPLEKIVYFERYQE